MSRQVEVGGKPLRGGYIDKWKLDAHEVHMHRAECVGRWTHIHSVKSVRVYFRKLDQEGGRGANCT